MICAIAHRCKACGEPLAFVQATILISRHRKDSFYGHQKVIATKWFPPERFKLSFQKCKIDKNRTLGLVEGSFCFYLWRIAIYISILFQLQPKYRNKPSIGQTDGNCQQRKCCLLFLFHWEPDLEVIVLILSTVFKLAGIAVPFHIDTGGNLLGWIIIVSDKIFKRAAARALSYIPPFPMSL